MGGDATCEGRARGGGEGVASERAGSGGENTLPPTPPTEDREGLGGGDTLLGILDNESFFCESNSPEEEREDGEENPEGGVVGVSGGVGKPLLRVGLGGGVERLGGGPAGGGATLGRPAGGGGRNPCGSDGASSVDGDGTSTGGVEGRAVGGVEGGVEMGEAAAFLGAGGAGLVGLVRRGGAGMGLLGS